MLYFSTLCFEFAKMFSWHFITQLFEVSPYDGM